MSSVEEKAAGPMIVRSVDKGGFVRVNDSFKAKAGFHATELAEKPFLDWIAPCDRTIVQAALENGERSISARHITRDGSALQLEIQVAEHEDGLFILGRCAQAPTRFESEKARSDEATVLGTLDAIARILEEQNTGFKCSILLVAEGRFVFGAGPSLPDEYNSAVNGYAVGPTVGSCGTAIFWNTPVIVEDIQGDPLWAALAALAKKAGVAACWSHPFTNNGGQVLGALAFYAPAPCAPTSEQLRQLKAAARMTGMAVERGRAEEEIRENRKRELDLKAQLIQAQKMEAVGRLAGGVAHDFNNTLMGIMGYTEMCRDEIGAVHPIREWLDEIKRGAEHAADLTRQLLAFARKQTIAPKVLGCEGSVLQITNSLNIPVRQEKNWNDCMTEGSSADSALVRPIS